MKNHELKTNQGNNEASYTKKINTDKTDESDIQGAIIEEVDSNERMKESLENFIKRNFIYYLLEKKFITYFCNLLKRIIQIMFLEYI